MNESDQVATGASAETNGSASMALAVANPEGNSTQTIYDLKLSTSVLYDLGINLYSSIPAVLSEIVANAWDADADNVTITFDDLAKTIAIEDDGDGMSDNDVRTKYLKVGFKKRKSAVDDLTPKARKVLGRKGIGKLAPLAIADVVELHTTKAGESTALRFVMEQLKEAAIKDETYHPEVIEFDSRIQRGTKILLRGLRKGTGLAPDALRKRVARSQAFKVTLNGIDISPRDREYLSRLQFAWCYGKTSAFDLQRDYPNIEKAFDRDGTFGNRYCIDGWLGTVASPAQLKLDGEVLNKVVVFIGGKVAHEDLLYNISDARVYVTYMVGELEADFLDEFEKDDIATSNRQGIIEDDERFRALLDFMTAELKVIRENWTDERSLAGVAAARKIPALEKWYLGLTQDEKKLAQRLIGKINQVSMSDGERPQYYKYAVLAFESLKVKKNLQVIDQIDGEDLEMIASVFAQIDDIEATHYYEITRRRLDVIEKLVGMVDQDVLERVLQEHVSKHLWLIDAGWDAITEVPEVEKDMNAVIDGLKSKANIGEAKGRVDIKYSRTIGGHIVIELKRFGTTPTLGQVHDQVLKYRKAIEKKLRQLSREGEALEIIVLLGDIPTGAKSLEEANNSLRAIQARVVLYKRLISDAQTAYREYLERSKDKARILAVMKELEDVKLGESD